MGHDTFISLQPIHVNVAYNLGEQVIIQSVAAIHHAIYVTPANPFTIVFAGKIVFLRIYRVLFLDIHGSLATDSSTLLQMGVKKSSVHAIFQPCQLHS